MTIGKKMGSGFGVLLALVVTLAVVVLFHLSDMHRQFSFVIEHDAPVIANARHLSKLVAEMETGQRGFVITGKDEFLEPYENALASFSGLLHVEKTLVGDNPAQVSLLDEIEAFVQEWREKAAAPEIAMRRRIGEATVDARRSQKILLAGVGKCLMDQFMALGHEIEVVFSEQGDWEGAFAVEIIEKCMADREDGQRGFLITGVEEFLDKYIAGEQKNLPAYFEKLRAIVSDRGLDNQLRGKIDQLEQLAVDWGCNAAEPEIAARRRMNDHPESLHDVAVLLEIGTGKRILDRVRECFETFIGTEEELTARRFASATQASRSTTNTTILLALVSVMFGGGMAMKITHGITKPVRRLADAVGQVAKGDLDQQIETQANDEIGALSRSFNQMVGNLKRLEAGRIEAETCVLRHRDALAHVYRRHTMGEMATSIAHELNQPLAAIGNYAQACVDKAGNGSPGARDLLPILEKLVAQVERAGAIIRHVRSFVAKKEHTRSMTDIRALVQSAIGFVQYDAVHAELVIELELAEDLPIVLVDPIQIEQVLVNLVRNALDATKVEAGSRASLCIRASTVDDNTIEVAVSDTGVGLSDDIQGKLFIPFSTTKDGGLGMGLAISRAIVEDHGGRIWATPNPDRGTTFYFSLPLDKQEDEEPERCRTITRLST